MPAVSMTTCSKEIWVASDVAVGVGAVVDGRPVVVVGDVAVDHLGDVGVLPHPDPVAGVVVGDQVLRPPVAGRDVLPLEPTVVEAVLHADRHRVPDRHVRAAAQEEARVRRASRQDVVPHQVVGPVALVPPVGVAPGDAIGDEVAHGDAVALVGHEGVVAAVPDHGALDQAARRARSRVVDVDRVAAERRADTEPLERRPPHELGLVVGVDEHVRPPGLGPLDRDVAGEVHHLGSVPTGHKRVGPRRRVGQRDPVAVDGGDGRLVEPGGQGGVVARDPVLTGGGGGRQGDLVADGPPGGVAHLDGGGAPVDRSRRRRPAPPG
jgi:hypothetical protein